MVLSDVATCVVAFNVQDAPFAQIGSVNMEKNRYRILELSNNMIDGLVNNIDKFYVFIRYKK